MEEASRDRSKEGKNESEPVPMDSDERVSKSSAIDGDWDIGSWASLEEWMADHRPSRRIRRLSIRIHDPSPLLNSSLLLVEPSDFEEHLWKKIVEEKVLAISKWCIRLDGVPPRLQSLFAWESVDLIQTYFPQSALIDLSLRVTPDNIRTIRGLARQLVGSSLSSLDLHLQSKVQGRDASLGPTLSGLREQLEQFSIRCAPRIQGLSLPTLFSQPWSRLTWLRIKYSVSGQDMAQCLQMCPALIDLRLLRRLQWSKSDIDVFATAVRFHGALATLTIDYQNEESRLNEEAKRASIQNWNILWTALGETRHMEAIGFGRDQCHLLVPCMEHCRSTWFDVPTTLEDAEVKKIVAVIRERFVRSVLFVEFRAAPTQVPMLHQLLQDCPYLSLHNSLVSAFEHPKDSRCEQECKNYNRIATHLLAWRAVCLMLAFERANANHPFRHSILSLISVPIQILPTFAIRHIGLDTKSKSIPWPFSLDRFLNSDFAKNRIPSIRYKRKR